jgi:L-ascorbate metabolism protein UlaG (beta-lactamase superfamily)
MIILSSLILILVVGVLIFIRQDKFGELPKGERLSHIKTSVNYQDEQFQNIEHTPDLTEGTTIFSVLKDVIFPPNDRLRPLDPIPSVKTDIENIGTDENILIWFGHSSYYLQLDGKKILVDPVFSGTSSPVPNNIKAFQGSDQYSAKDFSGIDYLFITHDHWDHLDYKTVLQLKDEVETVICGLGVGQHLESWGYNKNKIIEKDWNKQITLDKGFIVNTVSARHFSGRGFKRNKSLWLSFVLQSPTIKIFIGGDSGYGKHFAGIGDEFGPFDLAILENGQYDEKWRYIHMMPEEVLQAALDLKAKQLFPVHSGKFKLANHAWDEPLKRISLANEEIKLQLMTPIIGEKIDLNDSSRTFTQWWEHVK